MKPFTKQWRQASASFDRLPLLVRGLFRELHRYCDDNGAIELGSDRPIKELARLVGAHAGERRTLPKLVDQLVSDGCVKRTETGLQIANFKTFQEARRFPSRDQLAHGSHPTRDQFVHGSSTKTARTVHEKQPNHTESFNTGPGEKRREDKEKTLVRNCSDKDPSPMSILRSYSDGWNSTGPSMVFEPHSGHKLEGERMLTSIRAHCRTHGGDPADVARRIGVGAASDDFVRRAGNPLAVVLKNPGRYLSTAIDSAQPKDPADYWPPIHGKPSDPINFPIWNAYVEALDRDEWLSVNPNRDTWIDNQRKATA